MSDAGDGTRQLHDASRPDAEPSAGTPVLSVQHLFKHFGGVAALDDVSLEVMPGEVHGLVGENGSGKSTLIKILAGYHAPERGTLRIHGEPVALPLRPGEFRSLGLEFVHQDLGLVPSLSAVENMWLGRMASPERSLYVSWRTAREQTRQVFERYEVAIDPSALVADLRPIDRAMLAIIRAVEGTTTRPGPDRPAGLLVLDEPTVFLPASATDQLFGLVKTIVGQGSSVVLVSHDLAEVRDATDRITVLRDGRRVATVDTAAVSEEALVEMIVGHQPQFFRRRQPPEAAPAGARRSEQIRVEGLSGGRVRDLTMELSSGEVVGITGLVGSGFEELPYLLVGAVQATHGTLVLGERSYSLSAMTPRVATRGGMALIPADRQKDASIPSLSVADNMMLQVYDDYYSGLRLKRRKLRADCLALMQEFDVRPLDPSLAYSGLSGGNQQKALLAKWLQTKPRFLLLHEPTQGVDVGARQQILAVIRRAADSGTAVICASADYEPLAQLCDRVIVTGRGRVTTVLRGPEVTKSHIAAACYTTAPGVEPTLSVSQ
jgi:ribose transport system ATP-binding protein